MRVSCRHWSVKIGAVFFIQERRTKMEKIRIEVDKVILYYMDRVDPDGNLYRFYVYKDMASEIEYFCTEEAGNMTIPIGEGKYIEIVPKEIEKIPVRGYRKLAGGCFKNILSGERVKDIDIFFESESDFQEAVNLFNDEKHQKEGWKFKYRNEKVCAFQKEGENVWIEFIESEFGKPKEILRSFDFTVTKMAYYKEPKYEEKEDDYFPFSSASIVAYEYKLLYHEKFFEHLHMKRLVIDENIPFPVSTWERSYRYKGYGYNMCRETKKKLLQAIKGVNVEEEDVSLYTTGGWD
mgnify:CR=1 FL=1